MWFFIKVNSTESFSLKFQKTDGGLLKQKVWIKNWNNNWQPLAKWQLVDKPSSSSNESSICIKKIQIPA